MYCLASEIQLWLFVISAFLKSYLYVNHTELTKDSAVVCVFQSMDHFVSQHFPLS